MYASNLEEALYLLMDRSEASHADPSEFRARMESLRGYGRLPRGRENHETLLTNEQIADAILGLAATKPGWAGHVALVLRSLKPVGGKSASFEGADNLSEAVQILLEDKQASECLIDLSLTSAEHGTNANGHATLRYQSAEGEKTVHFVHQLAVSLHGAGAEKKYDPRNWSRPASRQLVLSQAFFETLVKWIEVIRHLEPGPSSDGSEYDATEAEDRRRKALGVRNNSRYLNVGVDNQVTWPRTETLVTFDRFKIVMLPKTKDNVQSISMDLTANELNVQEARTVVNRFLSLLCFCDDQYAVAQDGWSGNPIPVGVPRRNLAFTTATHWIFDRKIPETDEARRALALYREARNAEQNFLVSYAVLSYYKIIEIVHSNEGEAIAWLKQNFAAASATIRREVLARFDVERGQVAPESHINWAYRIAVAHASPRKTQASDPDDASELRRLHTAAEVLRPIACYFIKNDLRISDSPYGEESN
jgi:hypothetical protein